MGGSIVFRVSRRRSMSTVFTNRIGDFCIFLFLNGFIFFSVGIFSYQFFSSLLVFILFVSAFIKGGQYPFGSWLPKAMAAPTPVNCLVHSSTLVTAGVMLMDCYLYICLNSDVLTFVFYMSALHESVGYDLEYARRNKQSEFRIMRVAQTEQTEPLDLSISKVKGKRDVSQGLSVKGASSEQISPGRQLVPVET
ncbi:unnamed protein product, partial [Brugia pahangi]|uniref:NADH:ubiquinone reductase (H(+)-translocating) n=1 Tax=Brugia pahangi TaxID=6280 RepID=A0A0N4TUH0_BRUPA